MKTLRETDLRGVMLPLAFLLLWYVVTAMQLVNTKLIVPPGAVVDSAWQVITSGQLLTGLRASLTRDIAGFAAGSTAGILFGLVLGVSRWAERLVGPTFHTLKQISLFAWLPLLSTWLGTGEAAKILFIALSAFYPVALNTFEGVRSVTRAQVEVARVLGFDRWQLAWRLILPAAAPQIATGLHLALLYAWLATIGAEYLLGSSAQGIGSVVIRGKATFHVELIIVGMLLIGLVGMVLNRLATLVESRVLHWRGPVH
ncbi:ABC transporter permease [Pseudoduganella lutea]|uniref:ABC transporter permease n=1 Tax=Pseudoduganella lutea TaxID=321985 RepID=A0A4P6KXZ2_9BURK|nr:ABC transporter permease [Pseudoduganella lutea]QBE63787.1 ABC transporter permease [Pseudoduganella lutea]